MRLLSMTLILLLLCGCSLKILSTELYYTDSPEPALIDFECDSLYYNLLDRLDERACSEDTTGFMCLFVEALTDQLRYDFTSSEFFPREDNVLVSETDMIYGFRGLHIGKIPLIPAYHKRKLVRVNIR